MTAALHRECVHYRGPNIKCCHFKQEIREIVARPGVQQQTVSVRQDERTQEPAEQPQRSHYASIRARLEQSLSSQPSGHHDRQEDAAEGILCGRARFVELADVVYFWALGEAYLQHPQMQSEMRWATAAQLGDAGRSPCLARPKAEDWIHSPDMQASAEEIWDRSAGGW